MKIQWSRREFLKTATAAVVLGTGKTALGASANSVPKRRLGNTGELVSCIGYLVYESDGPRHDRR